MSYSPKLTWVCCTFLRPALLPRLIHSFLEQDYPNKKLVIVDDAGQYIPRKEKDWQLISFDRRIRTLGEKRNLGVLLADHDTQFLMAADDDDYYKPWAMSAVAAALKLGEFAWPSRALDQDAATGEIKERMSNNPLHPSWGYRRTLFERLGGYPPYNLGEDSAFGKLAHREMAVDPIALGFEPYFIHCHEADTYHLSRNLLNGRYEDITLSEAYQNRPRGIELKC